MTRQAARSQAVAFSSRGEQFTLPVDRIRAVLEAPAFTPPPRPPPRPPIGADTGEGCGLVVGCVSYSGIVLPVLELAASATDRAARPSWAHAEHAGRWQPKIVLIAEQGRMLLGVAADAIIDLIEITAQDVPPIDLADLLRRHVAMVRRPAPSSRPALRALEPARDDQVRPISTAQDTHLLVRIGERHHTVPLVQVEAVVDSPNVIALPFAGQDQCSEAIDLLLWRERAIVRVRSSGVANALPTAPPQTAVILRMGAASVAVGVDTVDGLGREPRAGDERALISDPDQTWMSGPQAQQPAALAAIRPAAADFVEIGFGGIWYLLPIANTSRLLSLSRMAAPPAPHPRAIIGIITVFGAPLPVVDARRVLGVGSDLVAEYGVVAHVGSEPPFILVAEQIGDVVQIERSLIYPTAQTAAIAGIARHGRHARPVIDLEGLAAAIAMDVSDTASPVTTAA